MKKLLFSFTLILQNTVSTQTYYDVDNNKKNQPTFDRFLLDKQCYYVENDSLNAFKLMYQNNRGEKGSLGDSEKFVQDIK